MKKILLSVVVVVSGCTLFFLTLPLLPTGGHSCILLASIVTDGTPPVNGQGTDKPDTHGDTIDEEPKPDTAGNQKLTA